MLFRSRELCADALEQMGYQAESATWRNAFLYGAMELRHGVLKLPARGPSMETLAGLSSDILFDALAIRIDPAKAAGKAFTINWSFTDRDERLTTTLKYSTLTHRVGECSDKAQVSVVTTRATFDGLIARKLQAAEALGSGALRVEGDVSCLVQLFGVLDPPNDPMFEVLTPGVGRT